MTTNPRSIANRTFATPDGHTIAYYDSQEAGTGSDGRVVVLLHGFCGSSAYWERTLPLLRGAGRIIAPDLRGHGRSSAPEADAYAMEDFAEDLSRLLAHLNAGPVALFGHSLGGYAALAFAERHPGKLAAFGLVHSTAKPDGEEAKANRDKAARALRTDGIGPFVEGLVPKLFAPAHRESMADDVRRMIDVGQCTSAAGAAATALGMKARPDRTGVLDGLEAPRLLVAGSEDGVVPPANTFTADGPGVTQALLEGCGHMSMVEAPERLAAELLGFLNDKQ
ncbi:Pimeloyl-ACP methyl ester carboxylesterase [Paenibacillus sp. UNC496MF]|uniref:alpha/beta fold hydrolase n=1 Tax=Paenibacillus sp. UNC496MF TaxID=1502753 RepID=UPI0008F42D29|nr:alpha/beta hydrolase [Paenibacillus sp. UNC496MF]SFI89397.1 Pimeloyl-ACP methyl ester carboxylesterase [Paenibacillus sp. UNC496MF]